MSKKAVQLKSGMILVYTSARLMCKDERACMRKTLEKEACKALGRHPENLHIGIVVLNRGATLDVLPKNDAKPEPNLKDTIQCEVCKHFYLLPKETHCGKRWICPRCLAKQQPELSDDKSICEHKDWEVYGGNQIGQGYCRDCGKNISLAVLFDNLRKRMLQSIPKEMREHIEEYHNRGLAEWVKTAFVCGKCNCKIMRCRSTSMMECPECGYIFTRGSDET